MAVADLGGMAETGKLETGLEPQRRQIVAEAAAAQLVVTLQPMQAALAAPAIA